MLTQLTDLHIWDFAKYVRRNNIRRGLDLRSHWDGIGWMHGKNLTQLLRLHGGYIDVDEEDFSLLRNPAEEEEYFSLDEYCDNRAEIKQEIIKQGANTWQLICDGLPRGACEAASYAMNSSWCKTRRIHLPDLIPGYQYAEPKIITNPFPPPFRFEKTYKCKYCGTVTDCTVDEDVLCKDCREVFGHTYYSEL